MEKIMWRCVNDIWKYCTNEPTDIDSISLRATCSKESNTCGNCITYTEQDKRDGTLEYAASRRPGFDKK